MVRVSCYWGRCYKLAFGSTSLKTRLFFGYSEDIVRISIRDRHCLSRLNRSDPRDSPTPEEPTFKGFAGAWELPYTADYESMRAVEACSSPPHHGRVLITQGQPIS